MIRVLLAEDMRILRDTLVSVLNLEDDIKVVAQVAVGTDIVPAALVERPDLAVLDIDLPGADGLTAAAELHERLPACRVVILTVLGRPGQLRAALDAHVAGFMVKDAPSDQLIDVLRRVAAGERVIDPKLALAALEMKQSPLSSGRPTFCGGSRRVRTCPRSRRSCSCPTGPCGTTWHPR